MQQIVDRLEIYFRPSTNDTQSESLSIEKIQSIIEDSLANGLIPEYADDENSKAIAKVVLEQSKLIRETEKSRIATKFAESASHDLRTPITIINTSLYLLEHMSQSEKQKNKIQLVKSQVDNLHQMIEHLLFISKLNSGVDFNISKIELNRWLEDLYFQTHSLALTNPRTYTLNMSDEPIYIQGDQQYLRDAVIHLLKNAFDYSDLHDTIELSCYKTDTHAVIVIEDTGIGIGEDHLPFVFDHFYRVDLSRSSSGKSGMGLPIVRHVVEAHGGICDLTSILHEGTTVTIQLPLPVD